MRAIYSRDRCEVCFQTQGRLLLRNLFKVDPKMASFRDDPEIAALLKEPDATAKK